MIRAFIDASVIYAAIVSRTGASRELLRRHVDGEVRLVASKYVLEETQRNLTNKSPNKVVAVELLLDVLRFDVIEIQTTVIQAVAQYVELKDAPVVAAAIAGQCAYLLTYDKQHLLNIAEMINQRTGLQVATPGDLIQYLRGDS